MTPTDPARASADATPEPVRLTVRKGSRIAPLILVLAVVLGFVLLNREPGLEILVANLGLVMDTTQPLTFERVVATALSDENAGVVGEKFSTLGVSGFVTDILAPLGQAFLSQLLTDFVTIATTTFHALWKLAAYAAIPGVAGLIYRRDFWRWFIAAFVILLGIHVAGGVSLTDTQQMPVSGAIFLFLVAQIAFLLLANRLRRYSTRPTRIPPAIYNISLSALLTLIGFACFFEWGPDVSETNPSSAIWSIFGDGLSRVVWKWEFILIALPTLYILLRNSEYWAGQAPKTIAVCVDGTSNTPEQEERGLLAQTNVFKLFNMLKSDRGLGFAPVDQFDASLCKIYGKKQIAFYYAGVGNRFDNDPITQTLGLAAGLGAAGVVERAYLDILRVYRPGDRLYFFGFSRGAAIARLIARAIDERGAPETIWTIRLFGRHWTVWQSGRQKRVPISVLGCWDTVGAFGIAKTIAGINFQKVNAFKDLTVPDNVQRAYHMVALDEMRDSFEPTLMDPDPISPERIIEVWFAGDHANIGGGWATDKLSDVTLDFLLRHVSSGYAKTSGAAPGDESWGLFLNAQREGIETGASPNDVGGGRVATVNPDPLGQLRQWFSALYAYRPRQVPIHAVISETVFERMTRATPVYAPQSLFDLNEQIDQKRDSIDAAVARLVETHSMTAEEQTAILEYKNKLRLTRWPDYRDRIVALPTAVAPERLLANAPVSSQISDPAGARSGQPPAPAAAADAPLAT